MNTNAMAPVKTLNTTWTHGNLDSIPEVLDDDVVFVAPGYAQRMHGPAACADSFRQFLGVATVRRFEESDWQVDERADLAVVSYRFVIEYSMDGGEHTDTGRDLYVVRRDRDRGWLIVWRGLVEGSE